VAKRGTAASGRTVLTESAHTIELLRVRNATAMGAAAGRCASGTATHRAERAASERRPAAREAALRGDEEGNAGAIAAAACQGASLLMHDHRGFRFPARRFEKALFASRTGREFSRYAMVNLRQIYAVTRSWLAASSRILGNDSVLRRREGASEASVLRSKFQVSR